MRQYTTKAIFATGHRQYPPGSVIRMAEEDAEMYVREGTLVPVKDAETIRREALWVDLKAAAAREDLDAVFAALVELQPPKAAPEPPKAPDTEAKPAKRA